MFIARGKAFPPIALVSLSTIVLVGSAHGQLFGPTPIQRPRASEVLPTPTVDVPSSSLGFDVYRTVGPTNGLKIARFRPGSLAADAGLRIGDILFAIDGMKIDQIQDVLYALKPRKPGEVVEVQFVREGRLQSTNVTLVGRGSNPARKPARGGQANAGNSGSTYPNRGSEVGSLAAGVGVEDDNDPSGIILGVQINDAGSLRGAIVSTVKPDSLAERAGLIVKDRLVSVDGRMVVNSDAFKQALANKNAKNTITIGIVRSGKLITKTIAPKTAPSDQSKKADDSGLAGSFGSVLGGLFGGAKTDKDNSNDPAAATSDAEAKDVRTSDAEAKVTVGELPSPTPQPDTSTKLQTDALALGDDSNQTSATSGADAMELPKANSKDVATSKDDQQSENDSDAKAITKRGSSALRAMLPSSVNDIWSSSNSAKDKGSQPSGSGMSIRDKARVDFLRRQIKKLQEELDSLEAKSR